MENQNNIAHPAAFVAIAAQLGLNVAQHVASSVANAVAESATTDSNTNAFGHVAANIGNLAAAIFLTDESGLAGLSGPLSEMYLGESS